MYFTNNSKEFKEFGIDRLEKWRKYDVLKFWNRARSREPEHIAKKTYENYNSNTRLKKSSLKEIDKNVSATLDLEHSKCFIYQKPSLFSFYRLRLTLKGVIDLLESSRKKESISVI